MHEEREAAFIRHYLADPHRIAHTAAIKAGYAESTAKQWASRMLKRESVREEIARRTLPQIRKLEITAERVLQGLAELAFANVLDFGTVTADGQFRIDLSTMDRVSAGAIASIETESYFEGKGDHAKLVTRTKLKMADRRPALEALGRHLKILGAGDVQIQQPIRLVIMHAPPPTMPAPPLNITNLIKEPA